VTGFISVSIGKWGSWLGIYGGVKTHRMPCPCKYRSANQPNNSWMICGRRPSHEWVTNESRLSHEWVTNETHKKCHEYVTNKSRMSYEWALWVVSNLLKQTCKIGYPTGLRSPAGKHTHAHTVVQKNSLDKITCSSLVHNNRRLLIILLETRDLFVFNFIHFDLPPPTLPPRPPPSSQIFFQIRNLPQRSPSPPSSLQPL